MSRVHTVIFDMDGVLVDSEPLWQRAEMEILRPLGVPLTSDMAQTTTGLRVDHVVDHWRARFAFSGSTDAIAHDITTRVATLIREHGLALPGAVELVRGLHTRGIQLGLATSSAPTLITAVLERLNIAALFSTVSSATHLPHGKPHPAVYRVAARSLGAEPRDCIAIEDSEAGIQSAVAAGMITLAVSEPSQHQTAYAAGAIQVVHHLTEMTPEALLALATP